MKRAKRRRRSWPALRQLREPQSDDGTGFVESARRVAVRMYPALQALAEERASQRTPTKEIE